MTVKSDLLTTGGQPLRQSRCRGQRKKEGEEVKLQKNKIYAKAKLKEKECHIIPRNYEHTQIA